MALIGRLHPVLVHFPIALVLFAAAAEAAATALQNGRWRTVAVANVQAGAAFALVAVMAGWRLALTPDIELTPLLEWHRWLGVLGALTTLAAAALSAGLEHRAPRNLLVFRIILGTAAALVAVTGHLGGLLVWGKNFLRL